LPKSKRVVIAIVSDVHCGSTVAVCPPKIELDDGGAYEASKAQRWLWQSWTRFWEKVDAARQGATLYTVFNGDLTEGFHHGTTQVLTANPTAQSRVVDACMSSVLDVRPDKMFFVRGTAAHVGKSAAYEERIALGLWKDKKPVVKDPDTGTASWWHLPLEVQGRRFSFAHHGRMGQRPWTKHNIPALLAHQIFMERAQRELPHYHVAVRSHFHTFVDTHEVSPTRLIQTPAWQLHTEYAWKAVPENLADIGGVIITVESGELDVQPTLYRAEQPAWQT
jgi:hypothetical protein